MSPDGVAVSGPATNTVGSVWKGRIVRRTTPVARSTCVTPPDAAGIQSESPKTTAWNCGSQPWIDTVVGEAPRFGGGVQAVARVQVGPSFVPCQTKCCSFQVCWSQASGPQGKGVPDPGGLQDGYPGLFTET